MEDRSRANSGVLLKLQSEELNFQSLENRKIDDEILSESYIFSATWINKLLERNFIWNWISKVISVYYIRFRIFFHLNQVKVKKFNTSIIMIANYHFHYYIIICIIILLYSLLYYYIYIHYYIYIYIFIIILFTIKKKMHLNNAWFGVVFNWQSFSGLRDL